MNLCSACLTQQEGPVRTQPGTAAGTALCYRGAQRCAGHSPKSCLAPAPLQVSGRAELSCREGWYKRAALFVLKKPGPGPEPSRQNVHTTLKAMESLSLLRTAGPGTRERCPDFLLREQRGEAPSLDPGRAGQEGVSGSGEWSWWSLWGVNFSYSALSSGAGCFSFCRRTMGSRKSPAHTVKQAWAPASQYTEAASMGPTALARAPRLRRVPMTLPFCPGEP